MAAQEESGARRGGGNSGIEGRRQETKKSSNVTGAGETSVDPEELPHDPDYGTGGRDTDAPAALEDFVRSQPDEVTSDRSSTKTSIKEDRDGR
jgi:hypothetical protein